MPQPTPGDHRAGLELAHAVLAGDPAAFHKLFDLHGPPVFGLARRLRDDDRRARALASATLAAVFGHLDAYSGRTPLAAWVLAIARLVARHDAARGAGDATSAAASG